jgi:hypothetical protein
MIDVNTAHTPEKGDRSLSWPNGLIVIIVIITCCQYIKYLTHISMIDMLHASIVSDDTTVYRQC